MPKRKLKPKIKIIYVYRKKQPVKSIITKIKENKQWDNDISFIARLLRHDRILLRKFVKLCREFNITIQADGDRLCIGHLKLLKVCKEGAMVFRSDKKTVGEIVK